MLRFLTIFANCLLMLCGMTVHATDILITDGKFNQHFSQAKPGDIFTIAPGTYPLKYTAKLEISGTKEMPITIRPMDGPGKVVIEVDKQIGFKISASHWIIEGLEIRGVCAADAQCEHAMQIVGNADDIIVRNNRLLDFNAAIKGNGLIENGRQYFPDRVVIEGNTIYNRQPRRTASPVTPIDVVGGRYWTIRDNFIADFAKAGGNKISYAAFLKGNSDHGLFERNLVICEWRHKGGTRLGLSLGGGGVTNPNFCQGRSCKIEHYKGVIRSNVIMNCPVDVGIYLNNAASTTVVNNTIINTNGVDVRFNGSFATVANNIIEGRIQDRDGGRSRDMNNIVVDDIKDVFPRAEFYDLTPVDIDDLKAAARGFEAKDFCTGQPLEGWIGAFAYPAACRIVDKVTEQGKER